MGLIETAVPAGSSSARRSIYSCDVLSDHVLLAVGRRPAELSAGNLIDRGGILWVGEDQCALLVSRGRVTDFCALPGTYEFDTAQDAAPRLGPLEEQVLATWKQLSPPPGEPGAQKLYYVNLQTIRGLAFESGRPIPFLARIPADGLEIDIDLTCSGRFSYRICDPVLFFTNVTGSVEDRFDNAELNDELRKELAIRIPAALAGIAAAGTAFSDRASFCRAVEEKLAETPSSLRSLLGIELTSVTVSDIHPVGRSGEFFYRWMAAAEKEAKKEKPAGTKDWFCPRCGAASSGNFCPRCGSRKPQIPG